jgi:SAM-dependent methyltransferase
VQPGGQESAIVSATPISFDYEAKQWGAAPVRPRPWYIQGLKLRYCLDDLGDVEGACVDIGCGAGNMAKAIQRECPRLRVFGVDVSRSALSVAVRDAGGVQFRQAGAEQLPFDSGSLAAATMFDVLEHLPDPGRALAEVRRVLRPGGIFHLVLPLEAQPLTLYGLLTSRGWRAKVNHCGHIQFFSDSTYAAMAAGTGLPVRRARWSFHPLFALIDVAYFSLLELRGPVHRSVEDYLAGRPRGWGTAMRLAKGAISSVGWYESRLLRRLPGGCGHFTCVAEGGAF